MSIQVYFNRPTEPFKIENIIEEIRSANRKVAIASAWFTDMRIAKALIESRAYFKTILLNAADVNRESRQACEVVREYFENSYEEPYDKDAIYLLKIAVDELGAKLLNMRGIYVVGDKDWQKGAMHHKFVLIDEDIVWTGSYNFTYQAQKNYESILRIQDANVCDKFWSEVCDLVPKGELFRAQYK